MNLLTAFLSIAAVGLALPLAGSWLGSRLPAATAAERLAVSTLAGLSLLIWNVSVLNFFVPIAAPAAWLCLWPLALGAIDARARRGLASDFVQVAFTRRGALAAVGALVFLALLLAPLHRPDLVYYDGTSNHDAFFWISGAEQLKRDSYMVEPVRSATQPFLNGTVVLAGWTAPWGRIAAEGLLALLSALVGASPLELYLGATAALFLPWIAGTYLVARTFLIRGLTPLAILGLVLAQPLFVFFQANANLPNLLGVLSGALLVVAFERSRAPVGRAVWLPLVALSLHALLCSYPELAPFLLLPIALLWLRLAGRRDPDSPISLLRRIGPATLALLAGLAINPATTVRACSGFIASFSAARNDEIWANLFQSLRWPDYPAALATLTIYARADFTIVGSAVLSACAIAALVLALRRASDRFGAAALLSGAAVLLVYTVIARFNYGWQKSAQFGSIALAALLPVAALASFPVPRRSVRAWLLALTLGGGGLLCLYATVRNDFGIWKWSGRKALAREWFDLRDYTRAHFFDAPVLVDAATFPMPFFHGMWATYFLADSHPLFSDRHPANGGYLRDYIRTEASAGHPPIGAILVSADWAETFDADSPRLFAGQSIVLLHASNRVAALRGFAPETGVPATASTQLALTVTPHRDSRLTLELAPRQPGDTPPFPSPTKWTLTVRDGADPHPHTTELTSSPPWRFEVPLTAGRSHEIHISAAGLATAAGRHPFRVRQIRIDAAPGAAPPHGPREIKH